MKPAVRSLAGTLVAMAALIGVMFLVVRRGLVGGLMVVLIVTLLLFVVTALAVVFGKRKKNGEDV